MPAGQIEQQLARLREQVVEVGAAGSCRSSARANLIHVVQQRGGLS
jgi:hypothetical protein